MGAERNVRVVSSNTLLKYDKKRRKRDAPWEDVEWDELELVSGDGSPDTPTDIKITNSHPTWKELFEYQRRASELNFENQPKPVEVLSEDEDKHAEGKSEAWSRHAIPKASNPLSEDVHIIADDGYVPCHRVFLLKKSSFLDNIIEDFDANSTTDNHVITITLMDVQYIHLKMAITLLYTGNCLLADPDDEGHVRSVLKSLGINRRKEGINMRIENLEVDPDKMKKKHFKSVAGRRFPKCVLKNEHDEIKLGSETKKSKVATKPKDVISSSTPERPEVPTATVTSMKKPTAAEPSTPKVNKKKRERNEREPIVDECQQKKNINESASEDDCGTSLVPLPEVRKVAPGSLLPLHQQPRIIRDPMVENSGRSRRGKGRGRRGRVNTRQAVRNLEDEDEDSSGPRGGKYEQDHEYVPPGAGNGFVVPDDDEPEMDNEEEIDSDHLEDQQQSPKKRNSNRPRRKGSLSTKEKDDHEESPINPLVSPVIEDGPKRIRTRGRTRDSDSQGRKGTSSHTGKNDGDSGHVCHFCRVSYQELTELKSHLEANCARHMTSKFDIIRKYCDTCQSFFKSYDALEFMEHINTCVRSARPNRKRKQVSTGSSNNSPSKTPMTSPGGKKTQAILNTSSDSFKMSAKKSQKTSLDVVGLTKINVVLDQLSPDMVSKIRKKLQQQEQVTPTRESHPHGVNYVFKSKTKTCDTMPPPCPPKKQSSCSPPISAPNITVQSKQTTINNNESSFQPPFFSTPVSEGNASKDNPKKDIRSTTIERYRPGPLSKKKKVREEVASLGDKRKATEALPDDATKKVRQSVEQKENDPVLNKDHNMASTVGSVVVSTNPITTAERLRESLKKKLHPTMFASNATSNTTPTATARDTNKCQATLDSGAQTKSIPDSTSAVPEKVDESKMAQVKTSTAVEVKYPKPGPKSKTKSDKTALVSLIPKGPIPYSAVMGLRPSSVPSNPAPSMNANTSSLAVSSRQPGPSNCADSSVGSVRSTPGSRPSTSATFTNPNLPVSIHTPSQTSTTTTVAVLPSQPACATPSPATSDPSTQLTQRSLSNSMSTASNIATQSQPSNTISRIKLIQVAPHNAQIQRLVNTQNPPSQPSTSTANVQQQHSNSRSLQTAPFQISSGVLAQQSGHVNQGESNETLEIRKVKVNSTSISSSGGPSQPVVSQSAVQHQTVYRQVVPNACQSGHGVIISSRAESVGSSQAQLHESDPGLSSAQPLQTTQNFIPVIQQRQAQNPIAPPPLQKQYEHNSFAIPQNQHYNNTPAIAQNQQQQQRNTHSISQIPQHQQNLLSMSQTQQQNHNTLVGSNHQLNQNVRMVPQHPQQNQQQNLARVVPQLQQQNQQQNLALVVPQNQQQNPQQNLALVVSQNQQQNLALAVPQHQQQNLALAVPQHQQQNLALAVPQHQQQNPALAVPQHQQQNQQQLQQFQLGSAAQMSQGFGQLTRFNPHVGSVQHSNAQQQALVHVSQRSSIVTRAPQSLVIPNSSYASPNLFSGVPQLPLINNVQVPNPSNSVATVRLPVTQQMNPIRSTSLMAIQSQQMLVLANSRPSTSFSQVSTMASVGLINNPIVNNQVAVPTNNNNTAGPDIKVPLKCPTCTMTFLSEKLLDSHQLLGFCG